MVLNIAVNLERLSRWSQEGREKRVEQFLNQTEEYLDGLAKIEVSDRFAKTLKIFLADFNKMKASDKNTLVWAEKALTWANILTHRAKLV